MADIHQLITELVKFFSLDNYYTVPVQNPTSLITQILILHPCRWELKCRNGAVQSTNVHTCAFVNSLNLTKSNKLKHC